MLITSAPVTGERGLTDLAVPRMEQVAAAAAWHCLPTCASGDTSCAWPRCHLIRFFSFLRFGVPDRHSHSRPLLLPWGNVSEVEADQGKLGARLQCSTCHMLISHDSYADIHSGALSTLIHCYVSFCALRTVRAPAGAVSQHYSRRLDKLSQLVCNCYS